MPRTPRNEWGLLFNPFGFGVVHMEIFYPLTPPMADTYKILGQSQPTADTWTDLYTVPPTTRLRAAALYCCNLGPDIDKISVALAPAGATQDVTQQLYDLLPLNVHDTFQIDGAIYLATTDVVRVKSLNGDVVFNLVGIEVT